MPRWAIAISMPMANSPAGRSSRAFSSVGINLAIGGAIGSYFFSLSFWLTSAVAAVAMIIDSLIADIEDNNDQK